ncbi:MAG: hypothetical protein ACRDZU_05300 [Acidimicrobiales bacterium]
MLLAHNVGGGALPAPPWLLSYIGAFAVIATAAALRATGTTPRIARFALVEPEATLDSGGRLAGRLVGLALFALVLVAAIVGPDSGAANIAPVAVLVIWWVGLPILCLLLGDVMRAINPFDAIVGLLDRRTNERDPEEAPSWTGAAFLAAFAWFFIAYHRPGSPRALAVFLLAYALAAVLGGLRWGRSWLVTGEGFGALSAAVALLSPGGRTGARPPGVTPLIVVWLGSTTFDAFTSTPFWVDVLGTSQGWTRTLLNTVGLVWLTAIVAGVYLVALRIAERADSDAPTTSLVEPLGVALVPLALGWFLAHDLTLLLFEGQNFYALLSDPIGEGWDLFGTIHHTIDYRVVQATWVRWSQVGLLAAGHVAAVVIAHDVALRLVRRRAAMRTTWALATAATGSIVAGALMVLG